VLVLRVEYLTGVCMATRHDDPERATPEWPPHPDRLYSALVAAAPEERYGATELPDTAKRALQWLSEQGAPLIHASTAHSRSAPLIPMPSNPHRDEIWQKKNPYLAKQEFDLQKLLPLHRKRTLLPIPAVVPEDPCVYFSWPGAEPDRYRKVLGSICNRVSHLGRSRSLVRISVEDRIPAVTHIPDPSGDIQLRVPLENRLSYLIDKHARDGGKPEPSPVQRYRRVPAAAARLPGSQPSLFGRFWAFRATGNRELPIESTVRVTRALRGAVLTRVHKSTCGCNRWGDRVPSCSEARDCYASIPSALSGSGPDCGPIKAAHVAFVSLPFVHPVQRHADGSIKGVAVLVPRSLNGDMSTLAALAKALVHVQDDGLRIPGIGAWQLAEVSAGDRSLQTLDHGMWGAQSRIWTTATPMVFGHFPKSRSGGEVQVVLESLRLAGVDPSGVIEIATDRHSPLHGTPPVWRFLRHGQSESPTEPRRWTRHVTVRFEEPVSGPLAIGAMRYFGLGLMVPLGSHGA
jgi:CRISPR-associated protein Csb2